MLKLHRRGSLGEKVELQMTPMIDIIFLLLSFFVMRFNIVAPEGDFNIKMPLTAPSQGPPPEGTAPITVTLKSDADGNLRNILFDERSLGPNFGRLRAQMMTTLGDSIGPIALEDTEVEIVADPQLYYHNVVEAMTAVHGFVDPKTGRIVLMVDKIRLKPQD